MKRLIRNFEIKGEYGIVARLAEHMRGVFFTPNCNILLLEVRFLPIPIKII